MVKAGLPTYVDTRKVFLHEEEISGFIEVAALSRLQDVLANTDGEIQVHLLFSLNDSKQRLIKGSLKANINVNCQRCLEPVEIFIEDDINIVLVDCETSAAKLADTVDPWICSEHKLLLTELTEEQLILCVPIVSYHRDRECGKNFGYITQDSRKTTSDNKDNPFAILKTLKS